MQIPDLFCLSAFIHLRIIAIGVGAWNGEIKVGQPGWGAQSGELGIGAEALVSARLCICMLMFLPVQNRSILRSTGLPLQLLLQASYSRNHTWGSPLQAPRSML